MTRTASFDVPSFFGFWFLFVGNDLFFVIKLVCIDQGIRGKSQTACLNVLIDVVLSRKLFIGVEIFVHVYTLEFL